jgi:hypothetical protein
MLGIYASALSDASSKPVPVYGDWKEIVGRTFTDSDRYTWNNYTYSVPHLFRWLGDIQALHLTFVKSTLKLHVNSTNIVTVAIGLHRQRFFCPEGGTSILQEDNLDSQWSVRCSGLDYTFEWSGLAIDTFYENTWDLVYNGKRGRADVILTPGIFWTGNPDIHFIYSEVWKYTPLDHYDNSTIENGKTVLSSLWAVWVSLGVSDFLSVALLIGLWLTSPKVPVVEDLKTKEDQP